MSKIVLDVLGILAVIVFGSFVIVLVADFLLSFFDKHEGVFFNKKKKGKNEQGKKSGAKEKVVFHNEENPNKQEINKIETLNAAEMLGINYIDKEAEEKNKVDMKKAEEEESLLKAKMLEVNKLDEFASIEEKQPSVLEPISIKEDDLTKVLPKILEKALDETGREPVFASQPEIKIEEKSSVKPKIIFKSKREENELEKIKQDVFAIKKSSKLAKRNSRKESKVAEVPSEEYITTTTTKTEIVDNGLSKAELRKLTKERLALAGERLDLIKQKEQEEKISKKLLAEKQKLEEEIAQLKKAGSNTARRFHTKEYYEMRLVELTKELKEAEKDLRNNKREYLPLKKVKKAYERDGEKLRRKETKVANQKIAFYGVNNAGNRDKEKKAKLDEEVKLLNELKESVFNCEQVLNKNKDRLPILEKANKLLTKNVAKIEREIENTKEALEWYNK